MLIRYLKKLCNRDAEIAALDEKMTAAGDIADAGEKLLRYRDLAREAHDAGWGIENIKMRIAVPSMLGGVAAMITGMAIVVTPLALAGYALVVGGIFSGAVIGNDAEDALTPREKKCRDAEREMLKTLAPQDVAASPCLDKILASYPGLRAKFITAVIRENFAPPAPQPAAKTALKL